MIQYIDLGLIHYNDAWKYQEKHFDEMVNAKKLGQTPQKQFLLVCEHPHVYTLGKSGSEQNLLINTLQLQAKNATFVKTNRGGDITYHGPGQIVGYPILDLEQLKMGIRDYIYYLEEVIIQTLQSYSIKSERYEGARGVWIDTDDPAATRKICSIGVRSTRYITMHGFALNVNTDLSYFSYINPCGFTDKKMTSMAKELQVSEIDINSVKETFRDVFMRYFQIS